MRKKEEVAEFENLEQQLQSFLDEVSELSRKKPNDPMNKFKLKFINTTLAKLNTLLARYRPFDDFEQFDVDDLPSNSDVVLILSQYAGSVLRFRTDNTNFNTREREWYWVVDGNEGPWTKAPTHFKHDPK